MLEPIAAAAGKAVVGYAIRSAVTRWLSADVVKRINDEIAAWALTIEGKDGERQGATAIQVLERFGGTDDSGPAIARVLRELEAKRIPSEEEWLAALLERWRAVRADLTERETEPQPLFELDEPAATTVLNDLAQRINRVCRLDTPLAVAHTAARVDEQAVQIQEIRELVHVAFGDHINDDITDAASFLKEGMPDMTLALLKRLEERRGAQMDARAKSRLQSVRGNALYHQDKHPEAALCYLRAYELQPDGDVAAGLQALAYMFLEEADKAFSVASEACKRFPHLARAHMVRIRCAPKSLSHAELRDSVPAALRSDPEVIIGLHQHARESGLLQEAELHAREAVAHAPDWPEAHVALATVILLREHTKQGEWSEDGTGETGPAASLDRAALAEALEILTKVVDGKCGKASDPMRAMALHNRAAASGLLGKTRARIRDLHDAYTIRPTEQTTIELALAYDSEDSLDTAIDLLNESVRREPTLKLRLLLAECLRSRGHPGDVEQGISILDEGFTAVPRDDVEARYDFLQVLLALLGPDRVGVDAALTRAQREIGLSNAGRQLLSAQVHLRLNDRDAARTLVEQAAAALHDSPARMERRILARLFELGADAANEGRGTRAASHAGLGVMRHVTLPSA